MKYLIHFINLTGFEDLSGWRLGWRVATKGVLAKLWSGFIALAFFAYFSPLLAQTCLPDVAPNNPSSEFTVHGNGTVTHLQTGLVWDRCTWGQSGANCESGSAGTYTWEDAKQQAVIANQQGYKGYSDWRLPTKRELQSLVEYLCYGPAINTEVFPVTPGNYFWSGSPYAHGSHAAWGVDFYNGHDDYYFRSDDNYVRLMRGGQSFAAPLPGEAPPPGEPDQICKDGTGNSIVLPTEFELHSDGTAQHARTGLTWDRCLWGQSGNNCATGSAGTYNWEAAKQLAVHVNHQAYKGHSDWRLPTQEELVTITEEACYNPAINTSVFPSTPSTGDFIWRVWSGSPSAHSLSDAWSVGVLFGGDVYSSRSFNDDNHVRLVRGGQSFGSLPLFSVSTEMSGNGTVSGAGNFNAGQAVTLTATPAAGYSFAGWSPSPCASSFAMPSNNLTCTANFTQNPPPSFTLSLNQTGNGTVSGAGNFAAGQAVTLNATPAADYSFSGWSPSPCAASFAMPANALTCTATFNLIPPQTYAVTLTQTGAGTLSGAGRFTADAQVTLTATPAQGYGFTGWSPATCSNTFNMPANDLACHATFHLIPASGLGKAIIITASSAHPSNTLFPISEELTRTMYRTLYQRGFERADILWLNPKTWQDVDGDGVADNGVVTNDLAVPETALEQAFAAMSGLQAGQQFVLHIHGHALQNQLKITREYWLSATQLKALLDKIPAGVQQVVVMDTCFSGSFLDELQGNPNRIVLTASDAESAAWNAKYATFSGELINHLRGGRTVREAFLAAEDMMRGSPQLFGAQRPQLDDDGDGLYSSRDGTRAAQLVLGKAGLRAADAPEIVQVHGRLSLSSSEAVLWVKTSPTAEQIRKVRATLIPPTFAADNYAGEATDFGRIELEMLYNPAQTRFEAVQHFNQAGLWKVLYSTRSTFRILCI